MESLRGQTVEQLIDTALKDLDHDPRAITEARVLPDFCSEAERKDLLNSRRGSATLIAYLPLAQIAFDGESFMDLSSLTHIASNLLREATLCYGGRYGKIN